MWSEIIVGFSLMFVIEGVMLALGPQVTKKTMRDLSNLPTSSIRIAGIGSMLLGLCILLATQ